jgi:hypothetical protein
MLVSIPLNEFSRVKLTAKVNDSGTFSLSFQPVDSDSENGLNHDFKLVDDASTPSVFAHFDSSFEDGRPTLSVYMTTTQSRQLSTTDTVLTDREPESKWSSSGWRTLLAQIFSQCLMTPLSLE